MAELQDGELGSLEDSVEEGCLIKSYTHSKQLHVTKKQAHCVKTYVWIYFL